MNGPEQPEKFRPRVAITHGDPNGIGPEVTLKALSDERVFRQFEPVLVGSGNVLRRFANQYRLKRIGQLIPHRQASKKSIQLVDVLEGKKARLKIGRSTKEGGELAMEAVRVAVDLAMQNKVDAVVTAPISKHAIGLAGYEFPGHTEFLAERTGTESPLMMMVAGNLRVGLVTSHIPLGHVAEEITQDAVQSAIERLHRSLTSDFDISRPKIAVLGLNPHAGEGGVLGNEEEEEILPAIRESFKNKIMAFGPFPADGFFGIGSHRKFDAVLAMYHDQGLAPFKALAFEEGVNYTAGLPIVRTSPDHGTAFDIAGKNQASPQSMRQALYTAVDIARNRKDKGS